MSVKPIDLTGGKSVYCFNERQLQSAFDLFKDPGSSGDKIRAEVARLEEALSRNERAALAFVLIDRLSKTSAY